MRILISTHCLTIIGGVERYLQTIIPALLERGHEIAVLYEYSQPKGERLTPADVPAFVEESQIQAWKPDVIYAHGSADIARDERLTAWPTVFYAHNYYGTCATGTKCHGNTRPCSRTFGLACLAMNYLRGCGIRHPWKLWRAYRDHSWRLRILAGFRRVLVAGEAMRAEYIRHGLPNERVRRLPIPVEKHPAIGKRLARSNQIAFVGRCTAIKGGHLLGPAVARAAAKLERPLSLLFVGDGPELPRWLDLARRAGVPTQSLGWQGAVATREAVAGCDLLAVPSVWPEPFGLVGPEAGLLGVPAVAFAVGGIPDWLMPGVAGELAPANPPTSHRLAEAIVRVLSDDNHYRRLCQGARESALRFSMDTHLQALLPILNEVAGG